MSEPITRILVVDDEQHQLDTVCRGLLLYGFRCEGVLSVRAAIEALEQNDDFDLVLTDLTMPEHSGLELIDRLQQSWPGLPIVVVTGLAATESVATVREKNISFLQKPFEPDTLVEVIRAALRGK